MNDVTAMNELKESGIVKWCSQCGEEFSQNYSHCEDHIRRMTIAREERQADSEAREADRRYLEGQR